MIAALIGDGSGAWVTLGLILGTPALLWVAYHLLALPLAAMDRWESEVDRRNRERRAVARALQPEKGER